MIRKTWRWRSYRRRMIRRRLSLGWKIWDVEGDSDFRDE